MKPCNSLVFDEFIHETPDMAEKRRLINRALSHPALQPCKSKRTVYKKPLRGPNYKEQRYVIRLKKEKSI